MRNPIQAQIGLTDFQLLEQSRNHPAAAVMLTSTNFSGTFRNDFCMQEMMYKEVRCNIIKNANAVMLTASHYGFSHYGDLPVAIGYGRQFGDRISIALRGFYLMNHATHYPSRHSCTIDISAFYQISAKSSLAITVYNPIRMKYEIVGECLIPMQFKLDFCYQSGDKLCAHIHVYKTIPGELDIGAKLDYHPIKNLFLNLDCTSTHVGVGIHVPCRKFLFSVQTAWFYRISISPGCDIHFIL
ncbi:MAG: hypothetical protein MJZ57_07575 [Bacteroidales bacterium]|nr:hypothetical protein [Bacteroidales bacterium]